LDRLDITESSLSGVWTEDSVTILRSERLYTEHLACAQVAGGEMLNAITHNG